MVLIESMKMHHDVPSPLDGRIAELRTTLGATVMAGDVLATVDAVDAEAATADGDRMTSAAAAAAGAPAERPDLAESVQRHASGSTRPARTPSPGAAHGAGARPARTSPTSSTTGRSSSTARSSSPRSAAGARSRT